MISHHVFILHHNYNLLLCEYQDFFKTVKIDRVHINVYNNAKEAARVERPYIHITGLAGFAK